MTTKTFRVFILSFLYTALAADAQRPVIIEGGGRVSLGEMARNIQLESSASFEWVRITDAATIEEIRLICSLPALKTIEFGDTLNEIALKPKMLHELSSAKNLLNIDLCVTAINENDIQIFSKLTKVVGVSIQSQSIDSSSHKWDDAFGAPIADMRSLEQLNLSQQKAQFTNKFLQKLRACKKLRSLTIESVNFNEESFNIIGKMQELRHLSITLPNVSSLSFAGLRNSKLRELGVLELKRDGGPTNKIVISDKAYQTLSSLPHLESIGMIERWKVDSTENNEKIINLQRHLINRRDRLVNEQKLKSDLQNQP